MEEFDFIIIGSGAGGGTLASKLAKTGKKILILERGPFLQREIENWQPHQVFYKGKYSPPESWYDKNNKPFIPGTHYFVGGNTKFYGAALLRLRENDFKEIKHYGGVSPAWPLKYEDFKPYYMEAETLYEVHGKRGEDPTEPPEEKNYAYAQVSHEPQMQSIFDALIKEGLNPFHLPLGIRLNEKDMVKGRCIRCETCDGYPCLVNAKSDAQYICLMSILDQENVTLLPNTKALKILTDASGKKATSVLVEREGKTKIYHGKTIIASCGAINSAVLFLRSKNEKHKTGLANSSDQLGRNYMCHQNSVILGIHKEKNVMKFQKTLGLNDFYHKADDSEYPLGHIQMLGKVEAAMLKGDAPFFTPKFVLEYLASHSIGWWLTSEDLPLSENRVIVDEKDKIHLHYTVNNAEAHKRLIKKLKKILNFTGHRFHITNSAYLKNRLPIAAVAHQVGTMRFGDDPKTSVLDTNCKTHDIENLYVVDGSFFPSSGAVNPGLTIIANALRIGDHLIKSL